MSRTWLQLRIPAFILLFVLLTLPDHAGRAVASWQEVGRLQAATTPAGTVPTAAVTSTSTTAPTTASTTAATTGPTKTTAPTSTASITPTLTATPTLTYTPTPSETPGRATQLADQKNQTATAKALTYVSPTPKPSATLSPTPSATPLPAPTTPFSRLLTTFFLVLGGISGLGIVGGIIFLIVRPRTG